MKKATLYDVQCSNCQHKATINILGRFYCRFNGWMVIRQLNAMAHCAAQRIRRWG